MNKRRRMQVFVDTCLLPLAFLQNVARLYNPFGPRERSSFARRRWFSGIRKFARVNDGVYIGSTPTLRGLQRLREYGINTVVNLRASLDYRDKAEALGFNYFSIPLNGKRPPDEEQVVEFLRVVQEQSNLPLFFHCNRARNRTYMLLGLYRIAHDGWSADRAISEMNYFGWKNVPDKVTSYFREIANGGSERILSKVAM
jgi:protein tyrosine phosphatase (PTP) superfamily phosphohydrolase (DUF442 family)